MADQAGASALPGEAGDVREQRPPDPVAPALRRDHEVDPGVVKVVQRREREPGGADDHSSGPGQPG